MRKTPRGGELGFSKIFPTQQISTIEAKNKKIELEKTNSDFIVVRHFLTYVHSP